MKGKVLLFLMCWMWHLAAIAQTDHFMIGIWSFSYDNASSNFHAGINTNVGNSSAFYQLFKDHGFNTIQIEYQLMPGSYYNPHYVSSSPSKAFLDRADSLGLKIILDCPDIYVDRRKDTAYLNNPSFTQYNQANSINGLNYYGNHPSIIGFAVCDEPSSVVFSDIGMYFSDIENYNPTLFRLANLKSTYAADTLLGYPGAGYAYAYPLYVENFIQTTHPKSCLLTITPFGSTMNIVTPVSMWCGQTLSISTLT